MEETGRDAEAFCMSLIGVAMLVLSLAALGGLGLAMLHGSLPEGRHVPAAVALSHGLAGAAGLALLVVALLHGTPHGASQGAAGFGGMAAALLGGTLLLGLAPIQARLRRQGLPVLALGLHATLAVLGLTLLAAYLSLPG